MTEPTSMPAGARGAFDLTASASANASAMGGPTGAAASSGLPGGLVVTLTEATFQQELSKTLQVPAVLVVWSSQHPQTAAALDAVAQVAAGLGGRVVVLSADLAAAPVLQQVLQPLLVQAFGSPSIPATFGVLQGQPIPLFPGVAPAAEVATVLDQLVTAAVQNGITGRATLRAPEGAEEAPPDPLHEAAFAAIEAGDLAGAVRAYEAALAANPKDVEAELGLAQVHLMQRTADLDPAATRAKAAANPTDVEAACAVADLDVLGGHVDDAFSRLLDLVRSESGPAKDQARTHLLGLFAVVGNDDERVRRGRTALMSALF